MNLKNILGREIFEFCHPKFLRSLGCSRPHQSINVSISVVEVRPRVSLEVVVQSVFQVSVIMIDQTSDSEAFLGFQETSF